MNKMNFTYKLTVNYVINHFFGSCVELNTSIFADCIKKKKKRHKVLPITFR